MEGTMNFSDKLKRCRDQKGTTQQELADYLHVSRKTVSGWENGRSYLDVNVIIHISDYFDVSFENLIRDDQVLSYYADQDKQLAKNKRLQKVLYVLNIVLLLGGYLHMFYIKGFHSVVVSLLLIINMFIFLALYDNWQKFNKKSQLIKLLGTVAIFIIANIMLNFFNQDFLDTYINADVDAAIGMTTGRILLNFCLAFSATIIFLFIPYNGKKR